MKKPAQNVPDLLSLLELEASEPDLERVAVFP